MIQARLKTERKAGPPAFLAALIGALTPRRFRGEQAVELVSNYTSLSSYCASATQHTCRAMRANVRPAFNRRRMIGDVACVFIAFNALPIAPLAGILVIAVLTLLWRDCHTYPPEASPGEATTDAMCLGVGLVAWQLFCLFATNLLIAPRFDFLLGLPFAMAMVAGWRFTLRWENKTKPTPTEAERAYRDACRIYLLWMVAVVALIGGNTRVVVGGDVRDFFYVVEPFTCFVIGARLQSERIGGGLFDWGMIWFGKDLEKLENAERATHLFSKRMKTWRDFSPVHLFEALFFISIGAVILIPPVGVLLGWIPIDTVHWPLLIVDAAVFVTLSRMWIEVKKIHEKVAMVLLAASK